MKKPLLLFFFMSVITTAACAETVTLSTYYPAPFGSYDRLRLVPRAVAPPCNASLEGLMYYDSTTGTINICQSEGGVWGWNYAEGIWSQDDADHIFLTDTLTNPNLRVGIGVTNPTGLLHMYDSVADKGIALGRRYGNDIQGCTGISCGNIDDLVLQSYGGNVGINTATPGYPLEIAHATHPVTSFHWTDLTGRGENYFYQNGIFYGAVGAYGDNYADPRVQKGLGFTSGVDNDGFLFFRTRTGGSFQDRMNIINNGNVGIGTMTPYTKLDVSGVINSMQPTHGYGIGITPAVPLGIAGWYHTTGTTAGQSWFFTHLGGMRFTVEDSITALTILKNSGNVGIGTTTPVARLDVAGDIRVGNSSSACNSTTEGAIRYSGGQFQGCNGSSWTPFGLAQIAHGSVSAAGAVVSGIGFTSSRLGLGSYRVVFSPSFASIPSVVIPKLTPTYTCYTVSNLTISGFDLATEDILGNAVDHNFYFIAM